MAYLYQRIMDVPGLSGTAGQRQGQLYQKLGSPMGGYTGSYDQNVWLLNQINAGNYGKTAAAPQGGMSTASAAGTIPGTNLPAPNEVTPFEQVLPFDKIFDPTLISQLAEGQLKPELDRQQYQDSRALERQLAASGAWRLGGAGVKRQGLTDQYGRALKEQSAAFTGQMKDWMQDWYNRQYENYYKNPARFKLPALPKWEDYFKEQGLSTSGGTGYTNPYGYSSQTGAMYLPGAYNTPSMKKWNTMPGLLRGNEPIYRTQPILGTFGG